MSGMKLGGLTVATVKHSLLLSLRRQKCVIPWSPRTRVRAYTCNKTGNTKAHSFASLLDQEPSEGPSSLLFCQGSLHSYVEMLMWQATWVLSLRAGDYLLRPLLHRKAVKGREVLTGFQLL